MYFPFIENLFFCFYFKKFTLKNSAGRYECDTALLHFLLAVWGSIKMSPWKTNKTTLYPMIRADNTSIWWIRVNCYPSSRDILSPLWWYLLPDNTDWAFSRQRRERGGEKNNKGGWWPQLLATYFARTIMYLFV